MTDVVEQKETNLALDQNYRNFLQEVKERLKAARLRASLAANSELVRFYWQLGTELLEKQKTHRWGDGFLDQLSHDMRQAFPGAQGFSRRNLYRMRQFALLYPGLLIVPQAVAQLPWGHISLLIQSVKDESVRTWYAQKTIQNGWSRSVLEMQIESGLYERQGVSSHKISNFNDQLPPVQSDLAHDMLKDPYHFDFLTVGEKAHEREIEDALVTHVRDFLLELGQGFAFVGSQVPLAIDDEEFFIDLLFYHLQLRCFVVVELKAGKFRPEHTGQLGFYLAAVDDLMRKDTDNPTIGILLCKSKSKVVAEYALRGMKAPMGVSEYVLSDALPKELESKLPSIEELEASFSEVSIDKS